MHKTRARNAAKMIRQDLYNDNPDAGVELLRYWPKTEIKRGIIAAYWPINTEIDPRPLMLALQDCGHKLCLPCIGRAEKALIFRDYKIGDRLVRGAYGTKQPAKTAKITRPDIILLPLLGFTANGHRLGYGGGYYDRTLAYLRDTGKVFACGLAFSGQEVPILPTDQHDQKLDAVLTERYFKRF